VRATALCYWKGYVEHTTTELREYSPLGNGRYKRVCSWEIPVLWDNLALALRCQVEDCLLDLGACAAVLLTPVI